MRYDSLTNYEETSAANFMVRDELMQAVIGRESLILVVGSCGAYFHIADRVVQMDSYNAREQLAGRVVWRRG